MNDSEFIKVDFGLFGYWLRETLRKRKMKRDDLAEKSGISLRTINRYISGEMWPGMYSYNCIMEALGLGLFVREKGKGAETE